MKKLLKFMLALVMFFGVAGCGDDTKNILVKVDNANKKEVLAKNDAKKAYKIKFVYANGKTEFIYTYVDKDIYMYDSRDNFVYEQNKVVFNYQKENKTTYHWLYVDDKAYEEDQINLPVSWFEYFENEKVVSIEEIEEYLKISVEGSGDEYNEMLNYYGYDVSEFAKLTYDLYVNANTYVITGMVMNLHFNDGSSVVFSELVTLNNINVNYNNIKNLSELTKRNVNIIDEKNNIRTLTAYVGIDFYPISSSEYGYNVYTDETYQTIMGYGGKSVVDDITGYITKNK